MEISERSESTRTYIDSSCPSEGMVIQAAFWNLTKTTHNGSPLLFISSLLNIFLLVSILSIRTGFKIKHRYPFLAYNIPLFLKNRSIII